LWQRLVRAEEALVARGMGMRCGGRAVYPWPWTLLDEVRQWLTSYLAHVDRASSVRLVEGLRRRFPWLDEYFDWRSGRVKARFPPPRHALSLAEQRAWFERQLPDHVLVVQLGSFAELWLPPAVAANPAAAPLMGCPRRTPRGTRPNLRRLLASTSLPVAWVAETGRRLSRIGERVLVLRWARHELAGSVDPAPRRQQRDSATESLWCVACVRRVGAPA